MDHPQCVVIGAGVIGCAVAAHLSQKGLKVWVLEQGVRTGEGISSRNSGVIHAGLYYPKDSLKAKLCIRGNELLYSWCETYRVPYKKTGKYVVATDVSEVGPLEKLYAHALNIGAGELQWASASQIKNDLPEVRAEAAFFSKKTGIIDAAQFVRSLKHSAEQDGAEFFLNCKVMGIQKKSGSLFIETSRGPIETSMAVNAAGLESTKVFRFFDPVGYPLYPVRGDYFRVRPPYLYPNLIYPVKNPKSAGLGVHLTMGLDGSYRIGPDAKYVEDPYDFKDPSGQGLEFLTKEFRQAMAKLFKGSEQWPMHYETCGIRPKLRSKQDPDEKDFVIEETPEGMIHCLGIESPGLTASLALAEEVGLRVLNRK